MKIKRYQVFADSLEGGKDFSIFEGVYSAEEMQKIAAESGSTLTGFVEAVSEDSANARFFSASKEKGASDSGALVVAEYFRGGSLDTSFNVLMGDESLVVHSEDGIWFSAQGDFEAVDFKIEPSALLEALGLLGEQVMGGVFGAGQEKVNAILELITQDELNVVRPDFEKLIEMQKTSGANGFILFTLDSENADLALRWFSPAKNMNEDNAGSFTVSSLMGFLVARLGLEGPQSFECVQGVAMGKASRLFVRFDAEDYWAKNIMVGGRVNEVG